jgi:hypothetical protein
VETEERIKSIFGARFQKRGVNDTTVRFIGILVTEFISSFFGGSSPRTEPSAQPDEELHHDNCGSMMPILREITKVCTEACLYSIMEAMFPQSDIYSVPDTTKLIYILVTVDM